MEMMKSFFTLFFKQPNTPKNKEVYNLQNYHFELIQSQLSNRIIGTPTSHLFDYNIELFMNLLEKHRQFILQLHIKYYLDSWILQSVFVLLCNNTAEICEENKFTDKNFCSTLLLVWDFIEDDYNMVEEILSYFSSICYSSSKISKSSKRKKLVRSKTIFFVMNIGCKLELPSILIPKLTRELNKHHFFGERDSYDCHALSMTLLN
ncbi:hypothetical protein ENUP19_0219G0005 [Entamoeba nuttalli]|uniref:Uncharacterized protein n=1 Tax=Entamoeba nuttalli TaxID=412467 RepID=A0ABQ0DPJ4_9EUKA